MICNIWFSMSKIILDRLLPVKLKSFSKYLLSFNPLVSSVHVRGHQLRGGAIPYQNESLTKH